MSSALDRRDQRYPVRVPGVIFSRKGEIPILTGDISFRGAFLCTDSPPELRQLVRVRLDLPPGAGGSGTEAERFVATGMVAHAVGVGDAKGRAPGVGVEFYGLDGELRARWERFVQFVKEQEPETAGEAVAIPKDATDPVRSRHPRLASQIRVELLPSNGGDVVAGNSATSMTQDISQGGMFIRTEEPLSVGAGVVVSLVDPRSQLSFPLECVVRRRVFGSNAGVGVEFLEMSDVTWMSLIEFLTPLATIEGTPTRPRPPPGDEGVVRAAR